MVKRSHHPRFAAALLAAALFATATAGLAQTLDEERGKELASEAMSHYKTNDFAEALEKFNEARAVYPTGQVLRMTGYTLMALEQWVEAARTLDEALATELKPLLPRDAEHAADQLEVVLEHVSKVELASPVEGAMGSVDGEPERPLPITLYLEPGVHRFVVTAPDHAPVEREQELTEGQSVRVELEPTTIEPDEPPPPPPPKPKPKPKPKKEAPTDLFGWFPGQGIAGLATAGVGAVFTGVAIGTGIYGASLRSAVRDNIAAHNQRYDASCTANTESCLADIALINGDGERAQTYQNVALGTGIAGGSLIAVGATLFLFSDMSPLAPAGRGQGPDRAQLICLPTVGGLGCAGTF